MMMNQAQSKYKHVLADISRSPLCSHVHRLPTHAAQCCHSNETHAPIANPPHNAQLGGTPTIPQLILSPFSSVVMRRGTDTQTRMTTIHFALSTTHVKCNKDDWRTNGQSTHSKYKKLLTYFTLTH